MRRNFNITGGICLVQPPHEPDFHDGLESSSPLRRRQAMDGAFSRVKQIDSHDA